jgi:hypothetical protein
MNNRGRPMRWGSLFHLLIGPAVLGGMALVSLSAQSLEAAQPGPASVGASPDRDVAGWHWRLTGTVVGPEIREAVFARDNETRSIEEGGEIDGWTLSAVDVGKAMLTRTGQTQTMSVDGLDDVASGRAALPTFAAMRAADDAVRRALAKQAADEKSAENILHQATKAMTDQAAMSGQTRE